MPEDPIPKHSIIGWAVRGLIVVFGDWLELALGSVMIFGSVFIAIACWLWLGGHGWWIAVPLIALNLAWTGAGVWLIRKA